jgi:hypothetical protein
VVIYKENLNYYFEFTVYGLQFTVMIAVQTLKHPFPTASLCEGEQRNLFPKGTYWGALFAALTTKELSITKGGEYSAKELFESQD